MAHGLGIKEPVTSPTFALSQHYLGKDCDLIHIDLYRLEDINSANELFLQEEEEFKSKKSIFAIEWPERLNLNLPEAWQVTLLYESNGGRIAYLKKP